RPEMQIRVVGMLVVVDDHAAYRRVEHAGDTPELEAVIIETAEADAEDGTVADIAQSAACVIEALDHVGVFFAAADHVHAARDLRLHEQRDEEGDQNCNQRPGGATDVAAL